MYKPSDNQVNFDDFNQPLGIRLNLDNRWVKKASLVPWDEIEAKYASLFPSKEGNVAKPARLALGALMIQLEYNFSDEETVAMIQENPYLQYFCGMRGYEDEKPFNASLMVHFRKRFTAEIIGEINEMIIKGAKERKGNGWHGKPPCGKDTRQQAFSSAATDSGDNPSSKTSSTESNEPASTESPPNEGTLIVDATCAPSYIKYPQDTALLNQAREKTEKIIDELRAQKSDKRPRTYSRIARKLYTQFVLKRRKSKKEIRRMTGRQLGYLKRNLGIISTLLVLGCSLCAKSRQLLEVIRTLYEQQREMYDNRTHRVADRIVSLSQPWLRPIVRGKTTAPVEFGVKLDVSVVEGYTRLETISFSAYDEGKELIAEIERYRKREGHYPTRVLADKKYRSRENLKYCKERGISLLGPALGRPPKDPTRQKALEARDSRDRIEVERRFSLAKRKYGLGMLYTKLQETTTSTVALSILLMNLNKVYFCALIKVRTIREFLCRIALVKFTARVESLAVQ